MTGDPAMSQELHAAPQWRRMTPIIVEALISIILGNRMREMALSRAAYSYPRSGRRAGDRAHKRMKHRRAAGRHDG